MLMLEANPASLFNIEAYLCIIRSRRTALVQKRVLVIDEDPVARSLIQRFLDYVISSFGSR